MVDVKQNVSLKPYNTFGVEAIAHKFIDLTNETRLVDLFEQDLFAQKFYVIGGGSNILFTQDFSGTIIHLSNKGIQHFVEGNHVYVTAAAGEIWNDLVWYCVRHNFPGLENMALIPGTVGGSPVQNIGAYGAELMDIFYSCRAFDTKTGQFRTFHHVDCAFTYRDSIFKTKYKGRYIILSVTYKLSIHAPLNTKYGAIESELQKRGIAQPSIKDVAEVVSYIRVEKLPDPGTIGNAGSFFKNPIISNQQLNELRSTFPDIVYYPVSDTHSKLAAGWLIEQCGWKGKIVGQAGTWKHQALVIVNQGAATGREIYNLSTQIVEDVYKKFGVELEREVNIL
ncbi:UDP-N-acetylmuramate dehydrogenase [Sphingobacterium sp. SGG-5]|uniref:UDP-N-acetylmuramate dehydrogenase n=1 Tax=Sphingobacterium sp. SGG-5 TaxID=2710881 RepID=UPI0013EC1213|nr:UDP-N-acetylmuramate dehydrogenase [Sphingobacterium sp. SGG-5]NGM61958.1 UDP-N-acetylmuramate dehydrogenase [Sphingobacterium sp. SGG-5]